MLGFKPIIKEKCDLDYSCNMFLALKTLVCSVWKVSFISLHVQSGSCMILQAYSKVPGHHTNICWFLWLLVGALLRFVVPFTIRFQNVVRRPHCETNMLLLEDHSVGWLWYLLSVMCLTLVYPRVAQPWTMRSSPSSPPSSSSFPIILLLRCRVLIFMAFSL